MPEFGRFVTLLWLIWLASWLLAAGWTGTTRAKAPRIDQLRYGVPSWIGVILLFAHPPFLGPLLRPAYPESAAVAWIATSLVLVGLLWTWWARIHLGRLWSADVALKEGHAVVRTGPYALTRHPIYSGLLLSLLATAALWNSWSAFLGWILLLWAFAIKLRQEERLLLASLGPEYARYRAEVPALFPVRPPG